MTITIIKDPVTIDELREIAKERYGDMVKGAVDIEKEIIALGGELHVDEEMKLIEEGSRQENVWGINLYPDRTGQEFLEFDSMINLKPNFGNRTRGINDPEIAEKVTAIVAKLIK